MIHFNQFANPSDEINKSTLQEIAESGKIPRIADAGPEEGAAPVLASFEEYEGFVKKVLKFF